jgi:hypothetical protein
MILVRKKDADPIVRFIVFVRPSLLWISSILTLLSIAYMETGSMAIGLIYLTAAILGFLCHAVTWNEWKNKG